MPFGMLSMYNRSSFTGYETEVINNPPVRRHPHNNPFRFHNSAAVARWDRFHNAAEDHRHTDNTAAAEVHIRHTAAAVVQAADHTDHTYPAVAGYKAD